MDGGADQGEDRDRGGHGQAITAHPILPIIQIKQTDKHAIWSLEICAVWQKKSWIWYQDTISIEGGKIKV